MTLREAMKLLELNERTLDISMLDSAARQRMDGSESSLERDQILEAYRRVQIFLDPSADERFTMRGSNVLAALSETREEKAFGDAKKAFPAVTVHPIHDKIFINFFFFSFFFIILRTGFHANNSYCWS